MILRLPGHERGGVCHRSDTLTDEMFIVAAEGVAEEATEENLAVGMISPQTSCFLDVSLHAENGTRLSLFARASHGFHGRRMSAH
jgi:hypothetical protein